MSFGGATRGNDNLMNIENVKGSHGDDEIDGDDNANLLKGLDGADKINGNGGDDTIIPNRPANADGSANTAVNDLDNTTRKQRWTEKTPLTAAKATTR